MTKIEFVKSKRCKNCRHFKEIPDEYPQFKDIIHYHCKKHEINLDEAMGELGEDYDFEDSATSDLVHCKDWEEGV